jgi:hypothetical protein
MADDDFVRKVRLEKPHDILAMAVMSIEATIDSEMAQTLAG